MECHFTLTSDIWLDPLLILRMFTKSRGYSGPATFFFWLLLCCFSFVVLYCAAWTARYDRGILAFYYEFSASPKLSKHHKHVLKWQKVSIKWHPNNGVFLLVLGIKQPSLVSLQAGGISSFRHALPHCNIPCKMKPLQEVWICMTWDSIHWNGVQCLPGWMWQSEMLFYFKSRKWILCQVWGHVLHLGWGIQWYCVPVLRVLRHSGANRFRSYCLSVDKMPLILCAWQEQEDLGARWNWESSWREAPPLPPQLRWGSGCPGSSQQF